jgi:transitional endoplasmic reticulum ATPase
MLIFGFLGAPFSLSGSSLLWVSVVFFAVLPTVLLFLVPWYAILGGIAFMFGSIGLHLFSPFVMFSAYVVIGFAWVLIKRPLKRREERKLTKCEPRCENDAKQRGRIERRLNQRREKTRLQEEQQKMQETLPQTDSARSGLNAVAGMSPLEHRQRREKISLEGCRNRRIRQEEEQQKIQETLPQTDSARSGLNAVAGMSPLKKQLREEVVDVFQRPADFQKYGIMLPNGILFFGPPGCGKTYIARRLADELKCQFFEVSPSDIADTFIHGTTMKIRRLFEQAVSNAPSVLFIDEFEALVPIRDEIGGGNQYKAEEVNEFLARMGSCAENGVLLIAASNAPWKIDPAVQRSGRLDKKIYVGPPDQTARAEILAYHLEGRYTKPGLRTDGIAENLTGYSSSDLKQLVEESARLAFKSNEAIAEVHLNSARRLVPPGILPEIEAQHEQFKTRGGNTFAAARVVGFQLKQ